MKFNQNIKILKAGLGNLFFCLNAKFNLDVHIAEHCNLKCQGCTHFSPIANKEFCDIKNLTTGFKGLSKYYNIFKAVQILGGEPLLNPEVCKILIITRKYFPHNVINLFTNGILLQNPDKLPANFWETLRKNNINIKITQYPINLHNDLISDLCKNNVINLEFCNDSQDHSWFRFPLSRKNNNIKAFHYKCLKLLRCPTYHCIQLVEDKIFPCPHSAYSRHLNNRFNLGWETRDNDYLKVDKIKRARDIRKFMITSKPFCMHCGTKYVPTSWGISKQQPEEWLGD